MTEHKFAYYDSSTDKIYGCKEETLTYYHEEGHQEWGRRGIEQAFQMLQWTFFLVCLPVASMPLNNKWLSFVFCIPLILFLTSELHAWIFAINKWRKLR